MKIIYTVKFKRYMIISNIFDIIISKFSYHKKICPVILLKVNKSLKISFYYIILFLSLAIYLKIKTSKNLLFDDKIQYNNNLNFMIKKIPQLMIIKSEKL